MNKNQTIRALTANMGEHHARIYQSLYTAVKQYETCAELGWQAPHIMPQLDVIAARIEDIPDTDRRLKIGGGK